MAASEISGCAGVLGTHKWQLCCFHGVGAPGKWGREDFMGC